MAILLAGYIAERGIVPEPDARDGARDDLEKANGLSAFLALHFPDKVAKEYFRAASRRALTVINDHYEIVEDIAAASNLQRYDIIVGVSEIQFLIELHAVRGKECDASELVNLPG